MDIREQIVSAFQTEHKEQVEGIRAILASLQQQDAAPGDPRWDEAFRMAHTLKGGARVCDLRAVEALGHRMESLFAGVREGRMAFDRHVAEALDRALDNIEDFMAALAEGRTPPADHAALATLEGLLEAARTSVTARPPAPSAAPPPPAPLEQDDGANRAGPPEIDTVRVRTQSLDAILRAADALLDLNTGQDRVAEKLALLADSVRELQRQCESVFSGAAPALRRMSTLPEFAGVGRHVENVTQQVRRITRQFRSARAVQQRIHWTTRVVSDELRRAAEHTRMVSAETIFGGLRHAVRSLARDLNKDVEFRATGLHLQADRRVLQALKEALLHALRNAVVHGIEPPDERAAQSKEPAGRISLTLDARGNQLDVLVEDDGRGIDLEQVTQTARQQGVLASALPGTATDPEELCRILFRPGFSTTATVTELAGRGMGLSVVHETVARLRGSVRIAPRSPAGTALRISVPMVVSAERLLLVTAGDQVLALPTHAVGRLLRLPEKDIQRIDDRQVAMIDDAPCPLLDLAAAVGGSPCARSGARSVVVLRPEVRRLGLVVDSFLAEREAVIRDLDGPAAHSRQFCGAVLLDDSEVALVVDPHQLAHRPASPLAAPPREPARQARTPVVLVVDDSFTTRTLEKSILETNGYDVRVAVDGIEALKVLRSEPIDMVIADVQMPRMDGLALLREIRGDTKLAELPLLLVTSLDCPRDYERGMNLGASAYIVKRRFDHQELLNTIQRFL